MCQVRRFQVSGTRFQVPGVQASGVRCQMPGFRCQVPGLMCHAPGIRDQLAREYLSDLRDQVPRENVENIHTKNILRFNGNYKLSLFSTEITNIQKQIFHHASVFFSTFPKKQREKHSYLQWHFRYFSRF